jgi:hypothetical protein
MNLDDWMEAEGAGATRLRTGIEFGHRATVFGDPPGLTKSVIAA